MKLKNIRNVMTKARGFTLLELIVVIAIIGVLSVVVLPNFATALQRGRDGRRISELKGLQSNLLLYYQQFGGYPTSYGNGAAPANNVTYGWDSLVGSRIEDRLPSGARSDNTNTATTSVASTQYKYAGIGCTTNTNLGRCQSYVIWAQLEAPNIAQQDDADIVVATTTATNDTAITNAFPYLSAYNGGDICDETGNQLGSPASPNFVDCGKIPRAANTEACTTRSAIVNAPATADCVFDLVP